jgi:putative DNA primase/helicase
VKGNVLASATATTIGAGEDGRHPGRQPLEENPELGVNFANGFLDMNLRAARAQPTFGKTFTMPFNYVPARRARVPPLASALLEAGLGRRPRLQREGGGASGGDRATMFGVAPAYQRAILLYGKGGPASRCSWRSCGR